MSEAVEKMMARIGAAARSAARALAGATTEAKNAALLAAAAKIDASAAEILRVNREEVAAAHDATPAFIDRMTLTPARIADMSAALRAIAGLDDPVGKVIAE